MTKRYKTYAIEGSVIVEDTTDGFKVDLWAEQKPGDAAELDADPAWQDEAAERIREAREFAERYKTAPVDGTHQY